MPILQPTTIEEDWPQYLEFEARLLRFTRYAPLIWQHEGTRSYYLVDLAQNVCSLIETTFKRMANAIGNPLKEDSDINDCRHLLEPHYNLSSQKIRVKIDEAMRNRLRAELRNEDLAHFFLDSQIPTTDGVTPFEAWEKGENPDWWRIYSAKKHNRVEMFNEMTLAQCMMAISALFLLNVYPMECREFLAKEEVIYTTHGGGAGAFWETILAALDTKKVSRIFGRLVGIEFGCIERSSELEKDYEILHFSISFYEYLERAISDGESWQDGRQTERNDQSKHQVQHDAGLGLHDSR